MSTSVGDKKVSFSEDTKVQSKNQKIISARVKYLWKEKNDKYQNRSKIVRSLNENLKIVVLTSEHKNKEIILNPRFITVNPFTKEETILVISDIFDINGTNLNTDDRSDLAKFLEEKKNDIETCEPKVSYLVKFKLNSINVKDEGKFEEFIELLVKSRLSISNYYYDDDNNISLDCEYLNPMACCDELYMLKYILSKYDVEYKSLSFRLFDNFTNIDNGIENIDKYGKLFSTGFKVSETVRKFKKGYFEIVQHDDSVCYFSFLKSILDTIYKERINNDI